MVENKQDTTFIPNMARSLPRQEQSLPFWQEAGLDPKQFMNYEGKNDRMPPFQKATPRKNVVFPGNNSSWTDQLETFVKEEKVSEPVIKFSEEKYEDYSKPTIDFQYVIMGNGKFLSLANTKEEAEIKLEQLILDQTQDYTINNLTLLKKVKFKVGVLAGE